MAHTTPPTEYAALRQQLAWRHWLAVLVVLCGTAAYLLFDYGVTSRRAEENLSSLARLLDEHLVKTVSETHIVLKHVADRVGREESIKFSKQKSLRKLLMEDMPDLPHLRSISLITAEGILVAASHRELVTPVNVADRDYVQIWIEGGNAAKIFIGIPVKPRVTNTPNDEWVLTFSLPVRNSRGGLLGVAVATIDPGYFSRVYSQVIVDQKLQIAVLREDGILLARYPHAEEYMGKSLASGTLYSQGFQHADEGVLRYRSIVDDVDRISAFRKIQGWPLKLAVGAESRDVFAPWTRRFWLTTLFVLLAMIGLFFAYRRQRRQLMFAETSNQALRDSERRFHSLFDEAPIGHMLTQWADKKVLSVNRAFTEMLGYSAEELNAVAPAALLPERHADFLLECTEELRRTGRFGPRETSLRSKYGSEVAVRVNVTRVQAADKHGMVLTVIEDISRRRQAEQSLAAEQQFSDDIVNSLPGVFYVLDEQARFVRWNGLFEGVAGYSREEMAGKPVLEVIADSDRSRVAKRIQEVFSRGASSVEAGLLDKKGKVTPYYFTGRRVELRGRTYLVGLGENITERLQAEATIRLYASVFEQSAEAILITDPENHILAVNEAFTRTTGYSRQEVLGQNPRMLASGHTPRIAFQQMWAALNNQGFWQGEVSDRRKDGTIYPKWISISVVRNPAGELTHYIASFTDITERKAVEAQISHLAHHDTLTGLLNRFSLQSQLDQALATARREGQRLAVLFIDLDRFKTINDTLGHAVGDALLIDVARRLKECVRESDIVARLGGDEFVVALTALDDPADAARAAGNILERLRDVYAIEGNALHATPSIGVAVYPEDGADGEALMKNADTVMYHAKDCGRNNVQFFTESINEQVKNRLQLEQDLRQALAAGQFVLHYQPKLDGRTGRLVGVEALLRWQHPLQGVVPPDRFIAIAEETGLIVPLGAWVLDEACRQLASWREMGMPRFGMAVNLSLHQLKSPDLLGQVGDALLQHGLQGSDLELEITESVVMDDPDACITRLTMLREKGVELAIDDFGTGYSSLAYLKRLPIHSLKLDRSFVMDIETDANDVAICTATIALAHNLGLKVIAEGVETEAQRELLAGHGCDCFQGYLFSRPLPAEQIPAFARARVFA